MARRLPPGFRFSPTDVELVKYYLKRKVTGKPFRIEAIPVVDIYKFAPWELPDRSCLRSRDLKWYFFCPRAKKYKKGGRMNRATDFGFWKTTGKDRPVTDGAKTVGMIRSLIFHLQEPQVQRTNWVMHEYRLKDVDLTGVEQDAFVICKIFKKEGRGPRNGAQYGAPFNEEEWDNDEDVIDSSHGLFMDGLAAPTFLPPQNQSSIIAVGPSADENFHVGSTSNGISGNILVGNCSVQGAVDPYTDAISCSNVLDSSAEIQNKMDVDSNHKKDDDIFEGLGDLVDPTILNGLVSGHEITGQPEQNGGQFNSSEVLELNDLRSPLDQSNSGVSTFLNGGGSGHEITGQPEENVGQLNSSEFVELNDLEAPLACLNEACQYEGCPHSNAISIFDWYDTSDSFSVAYVPCGDEQLAFGVPVDPTGQSSLNLSQRPQLDRNFGSGNFNDVFFEENGVNNCSNNGYIGHQNNYSALNYSGNTLGADSGLSLESLTRGYQRIPYRRLQNLRDPSPLWGAKSYEGYALLTRIGGTSLHVKAEVTRGSGGTKDALSIKMEGFANGESQNGSGLGIRLSFPSCMNMLCFYLVSVFLPLSLYIKTFNTENRIAMNIYYYMLEYLI